MALTGADITKILNGVQELISHAINSLKDELKSEISHLPTKGEFFGKMDEVMGELKAIREDHEILGGRVAIHSDEIAALQKIHPSNQHLIA